MTSVFKNESVSPLKKENFFYKHRFVFIAFLVPFFLMVYAFFSSKFYPFGDNQIMVIDMWHQYFPFLKVMQEKLQTGGSLLYSWEGGGGTNFIALISYYAASPLYFLSALFPAKYLTEFLALVVVLKISFSSMFMYIYLREMFKHDDLAIVAFSSCYALSAYAMGYYWCLMWLDVMALLPLCILGLNKLIDKGKFRLYTISLAFMMLTNYYIGVMMCIFIALYYPVLYFSRKKARGAKYCAITTAKAVGFSVIGCCIAAVILIPTYMSMQNTFYIDQASPETDTFYNPIINVLSNMFPNVKVTIRGGTENLPNIYCGVVSFMLAILNLLCDKIPAKKRILNCIILGFLLLSFNWNKLDFIWHGNHFPNELPYRYSFVFSFIVVSMACEAYTYLKHITARQIGAVAAGGIVYVLYAEKDIFIEAENYKIIYIAILLVAIYGIILGIYKSGKIKQFACGVMIFVIAFAELTVYSVKSVKAVGNSNRTTYYTSYDDIQALIGDVESKDDGFYRMEVKNNWTCNDAALYGYNGLSQFSSEINANVTSIMKTLGLAADPGSNSFRYLVQTPILNSMLNVKYIISRGEPMNDPYFKEIGSSQLADGTNASYMYQSDYPLSIGYMVNEEIQEWTPSTLNPFETQDSYVYYATGGVRDTFQEITTFNEELSVGVTGYDGGGASVTSSTGATATMAFDVESDGPIFIYAKANNASTVKARINSGTPVSFENNRGCIASVGKAYEGDTVYLDVTYNENTGSFIDCLVYTLDEQAWNYAYGLLNDEILQVTEHTDTKIIGTVNAKQDGMLFTSIPYEKGWSAYVDGEKVEIEPVGKITAESSGSSDTQMRGAFCAIDVSAGTHEIKFTYIPEGFILGNIVTFSSILLLIALYYVDKMFRKRNALIEQIENMDIETDIDIAVEQLTEQANHTKQE